MIKNVKEYLKQKTENLSFIELKEGSFIDINGYQIDKSVPLPMIVDELLSEIKEGRAQEELQIKTFVEGIIYTLGIDPDFKYFKEYKEILYSYDEKIENYILYKGQKYAEDDELDEAMVYFSCLISIDSENIAGLYNYALVAEEMSKKYYKNKDNQRGDIFLMESTRQYELILDIDPTFAISYYKLGYHYRYNKHFRKAKIMWEKLIDIDDDEDRIEDINQQLLSIMDDVIYEEGYSDILRGQSKEGLEKLLPLGEKYTDWWNLIFMIGLGYRQMGDFIEAKKSFEKVLAIQPNQVDTLNELGLCLTQLGKLDEAIDKFTNAISLKPEDYEVLCNRGMCYLQKGDVQSAVDDIDKAYEINSEDEITRACMEQLQYIKKNME